MSPAVAFTSNTPPSILNINKSNVPPPKSNIKIFFSSKEDFLSSPYAIAAAVGSFITRNTFNPAITPASFVGCRWESLKCAGTVITALITFSPI